MKQILRRLLGGFKTRMEAAGQRTVTSQISRLAELDCYHSVYFAEFGHCTDWRSPGNIFHSDAPIAIVVKRKGKVCGLVGFELLGRTMLVRQIQGAPKANFHDGTRAEAYLLGCAEEIAKALGMKRIRVVDADTAIAYREAAPPSDRPSEAAKIHMRRNYSYPQEAGYGRSFCVRLRRSTYHRDIAPSV